MDVSPVSGAQEQRWNKSAGISYQEFRRFSPHYGAKVWHDSMAR
jgi:hypothetical protein